MAMQTNFSEDESRKTFAELYHSEEVTEKIYGELIFLSVLNIFLSTTAFLGNTLILVALSKETSLHSPSKLLFRNLAITDLCVGIIAEPLLVAYLMSLVKQRWDICYELDYAGLAIGAILCSVSLFTLTAISVDRLLALSLGLRYRQVATLRKAYISVIIMWVISVVIGAAMYPLDTVILHWSMFITISLCVVISSLCYTKIFVVLRRRKIRLEDSAFQGPTEVIKVPLNLASSIQKGSVQCIMGAGNIGSLLSAVWNCDNYTRDFFVGLPHDAHFTSTKLIIKPVHLLLEDQRSKASC